MPKKRTAPTGREQIMLAALNALNEAHEVVAESDSFAMACDGQVLHSRQAMSDEQFDRMWSHINRARRFLRNSRR